MIRTFSLYLIFVTMLYTGCCMDPGTAGLEIFRAVEVESRVTQNNIIHVRDTLTLYLDYGQNFISDEGGRKLVRNGKLEGSFRVYKLISDSGRATGESVALADCLMLMVNGTATYNTTTFNIRYVRPGAYGYGYRFAISLVPLVADTFWIEFHGVSENGGTSCSNQYKLSAVADFSRQNQNLGLIPFLKPPLTPYDSLNSKGYYAFIVRN
ncbi:MAG: hypothetical protein K1X81_07920 [Bacteroidia bacterium]|nr:hypothetical protein [Bacteroidia bacterium]